VGERREAEKEERKDRREKPYRGLHETDLRLKKI